MEVEANGVDAAGEKPGADGTGKGGTFAFVNSTTIVGTWSVTFTDNTTVHPMAPDSGYKLQHSATLTATPIWQDL